MDNHEKQIDQNGLQCIINGHETYFESYLDDANSVLGQTDDDRIKQDLTNQDTAISFLWGADFAAGACIVLISIALTDLSDALIYYMHDQIRYTREMLIADTPQYLKELSKQANKDIKRQEVSNPHQTNLRKKSIFWERLKNIFK